MKECYALDCRQVRGEVLRLQMPSCRSLIGGFQLLNREDIVMKIAVEDWGLQVWLARVV